MRLLRERGAGTSLLGAAEAIHRGRCVCEECFFRLQWQSGVRKRLHFLSVVVVMLTYNKSLVLVGASMNQRRTKNRRIPPEAEVVTVEPRFLPCRDTTCVQATPKAPYLHGKVHEKEKPVRIR